MSEPRLAYDREAPLAYKPLLQSYAAVRGCGIEASLLNLVFMRISQINGCAYCLDLHGREMRSAGETPARMDGLSAWREHPGFTPREKAALGWAESLTLIHRTHACDADYQAVRQSFADSELANLSVAIVLMNAFNRLAIGFRKELDG